MKKEVHFRVQQITEADVMVELDVPEEYLDDDGDIFDEDGLRDWLDENHDEWDSADLHFESVEDTEVLEVFS
ncbi:hypothetical protein [Streptomyces sp. NPDC006134]|uniref:hypothetical protein n=1 Tax=Streptomyces sp. NPDC006134 TaxID=3154467 RepID=UPI0033F8680B